MADSYKRLGAIAPADAYEKVLYSTAAGKSALVSNITVTNRGSSAETFSVNVYDSVLIQDDLDPVLGTVSILSEKDYQASSNVLLISQDGGTNWTSATMPSAQDAIPEYAAAGNGSIVAVPGWGNTYYVSTDNGATFQTASNPYGYSALRVLFLNGQFVFTKDYGDQGGGFFYTSTDGLTLTPVAVPDFMALGFYAGITRFIYGAGLYAIFPDAPYYNTYLTSPDLTNWTVRVLPANVTGYFPEACIYTGSKFAYLGDNGSGGSYIYESTDGVTWDQPITSMPNSGGVSLASDGVGYVVSLASPGMNGNEVMISTDGGLNWFEPYYSLLNYSGYDFKVKWNGVNYILAASSTSTIGVIDSNGGSYGNSSIGLSGLNMLGSFFGSPVVQAYNSPASKSVYKNVTILPNETEVLEPGISLNTGNTIVVTGSSALTISAFGVELDVTDKYKILGQGTASAPATVTNAYTVPSDKQALIRSIVVTNNSDATDYFDISVLATANASIQNADYVFKSAAILPNETVIIKAGYALASNNAIKVNSVNGTTNFTFFGVEL